MISQLAETNADKDIKWQMNGYQTAWQLPGD